MKLRLAAYLRIPRLQLAVGVLLRIHNFGQLQTCAKGVLFVLSQMSVAERGFVLEIDRVNLCTS